MKKMYVISREMGENKTLKLVLYKRVDDNRKKVWGNLSGYNQVSGGMTDTPKSMVVLRSIAKAQGANGNDIEVLDRYKEQMQASVNSDMEKALKTKHR